MHLVPQVMYSWCCSRNTLCLKGAVVARWEVPLWHCQGMTITITTGKPLMHWWHRVPCVAVLCSDWTSDTWSRGIEKYQWSHSSMFTPWSRWDRLSLTAELDSFVFSREGFGKTSALLTCRKCTTSHQSFSMWEPNCSPVEAPTSGSFSVLH